MAELFYCKKCNKTMNENQFYGSNNTEKYPSGKLDQCKKCITMHVDNFDPDSYLWILQECDVPYIPDEWNKLLATYAKDKSKLTGATILGRYLAKMKLKQFKDYRWKDTEFLQELANHKIEETMKRQGYDAQQIAEAVNKATFELPVGELKEPEFEIEDNPYVSTGEEDYFAERAEVNLPELDLTEEEITYLRLKWGKTYRPDEWVALEKLYTEMMDSYDIQTAGHIDTLKLLCKTSLKANQLIDLGDVEGFQKMQKAYDALMKSGNFQAAQNKADKGEFVDSIGELVAVCETEGFIPRYYVSDPQDMVDITIRDMQRYTRTLIEEETNLSQMLEDAIKQVEREDAAASEMDDEDVDDEDDVIEEVERELQTEDFEEYNQFLENEEISDASLTDFLTENSGE